MGVVSTAIVEKAETTAIFDDDVKQVMARAVVAVMLPVLVVDLLLMMDNADSMAVISVSVECAFFAIGGCV